MYHAVPLPGSRLASARGAAKVRAKRPTREDAGLGSLLFYFGLTAGSGIAAWYALGRGLPPDAVVFGSVATATAAVALAERIRPYRRAWREPHGDVRTDVLHLVFSTGVVLVVRWVVASTLARAGVSLRADLWPLGSPFLAQLALALLVEELFSYWIHRAAHGIPLLWRFHAVHHSAPRVYFLNQMRSHPVDGLVASLSLLPVVVLGAPEPVLAVLVVVTSVHAFLQHANVKLRLGALNYVLSMAEVHRFHHSRERAEADANYGGVLLVWDIVFGTRKVPAGREPPLDTGLADRDFPSGYLGQLAAPFRLKR
jgi:sterol desaturase/sphingolipid hydroxylase (fatty acid hydroxylase superfamily)